MIKQKIIKFNNRIKERITSSFLSMKPENVAYHYLNVAGDYEKRLIEEVLKIKSSKYIARVRYYINHPIEMEEKINCSNSEKQQNSSKLENEVK
jgi:hypothetical protein